MRLARTPVRDACGDDDGTCLSEFLADNALHPEDVANTEHPKGHARAA